ncbi:unnamed protein product, partial [Tetraodon nigroviridis]
MQQPSGLDGRVRCLGLGPLQEECVGCLSLFVRLTGVKYIREVSPLFKKPSLVADLPWDGVRPQSPSYSGSEDSGSPKHGGSSPSKDRKVISLKMCFISRNLTMPDLENRLLELHSPDGQHTVVLRCKDAPTANSWFTAMHTNIAALLPQVLAHINAYLGASVSASTHPHLKHIGWLAEQIQLEGGRQQYKPVVMALTEKDILLFESVPWSRESWSLPLLTHPLLATRLVHSGSARGSPAQGSELVFATRTATGRGIESHVFRVIRFPHFLYQRSELNVLKRFSAQAQARLGLTRICSRHSCLRLNKNHRRVKRHRKGRFKAKSLGAWDLQKSTRLVFEIKYIREVSPLFKKPSLVADLPWDGVRPQSPSYSGSEDSGSPKHGGSSPSKDRKVISLKMCFISRNLTMPDLENRLLELHSPDGQHTVVLRCKDAPTANSWFTAMHTNIAALLPQVLAHINAYLGASVSASTHPHLKHIGWLAEQIQLEGGRQQYKPVVMALTEKDILLFESVPWSRESWSLPLLTHPLLATRLVHSGSARGSPAQGSELVFATRTGTGRGIESHVFRVETHWDLSSWTRALVQGAHAAAELIKEVSIGCTLNRQEVRLTLHYEKGFTVTREPADLTGGAVLFRYPYEKLKMSADDGIRNLYLDFGGPEGEMVSLEVFDLHSGPKPVVFVLHSFLSAKLTRMGLL